MDDKLKSILKQVKSGSLHPDEAREQITELYVKDLGYAKLDMHRAQRTGYPEVVFCQGKSASHLSGIFSKLCEKYPNVLGTRATPEHYEAVRQILPGTSYHEQARLISRMKERPALTTSYIAIVTAGTSDIPVAEEAALTAEFFGNRTERIYDVGVAGIHRLMGKLDTIRRAGVVIVVAGMEGALASVVGGLVDKPVIAVPTSVGYGASFDGLAALLTMLNSCASGVSVVNIDNGFGAAMQASMINKM
jgi:pyridinium-3,5-biscarboxylic acid mononucleotide synthase